MAATFPLPPAPGEPAARVVLTPEQVVEIANRRAAEATSAYLVGRGLAAEIGALACVGHRSDPETFLGKERVDAAESR